MTRAEAVNLPVSEKFRLWNESQKAISSQPNMVYNADEFEIVFSDMSKRDFVAMLLNLDRGSDEVIEDSLTMKYFFWDGYVFFPETAESFDNVFCFDVDNEHSVLHRYLFWRVMKMTYIELVSKVANNVKEIVRGCQKVFIAEYACHFSGDADFATDEEVIYLNLSAHPFEEEYTVGNETYIVRYEMTGYVEISFFKKALEGSSLFDVLKSGMFYIEDSETALSEDVSIMCITVTKNE